MTQSETVATESPAETRGPDVSAATRETLEDYTLRFAPRHYRKWTPAVVGISALGGIAYLAIVLAVMLPPVLALATKGRWYLRRSHDGIELPMYDEHGNPSGAELTCHVCDQAYERPDMVACETHDAHVCSLDLSTDRTGEHVLPALTGRP
jgi:hypothetical protein